MTRGIDGVEQLRPSVMNRPRAALVVAVQRAAALGVVKFACREIGRGFGLLRILNCGLCLLEGVVRPEAAVVQQRVGWTPFVELHHQAKLLARVVADKSRETIAVIFRVLLGVRQVLPAHRFALVSNFRFTVFAEPPQSHSISAAANTDSPAPPLARPLVRSAGALGAERLKYA